jgi:hypothetical protein
MAKQSGLAQTTLSVDDATGTPQDIRNDITNWSLKTPRAVQETTGVDKSAIERILLLADCQYTLDGVFNPAANKSHAVLSSAASTAVTRTVSLVVGGATLGPTENVLTSYDLKRSAKGELGWASVLMLQDGSVPTWS